MEKGMKQNIILLIITIAMLLINIIYNVWQIIDYESRKDSGNDRWKEVENIMLDYKKQIDELRSEIKNVY